MRIETRKLLFDYKTLCLKIFASKKEIEDIEKYLFKKYGSKVHRIKGWFENEYS